MKLPEGISKYLSDLNMSCPPVDDRMTVRLKRRAERTANSQIKHSRGVSHGQQTGGGVGNCTAGKESMGHTKLPWKQTQSAVYDQIETLDGELICFIGMKENSKANAAFIVEACNNYDRLKSINADLLVACKAAKEKQTEAVAVMEDNNLKIDDLSQPMQKLAFTFYTMIVETAYQCEKAMEKEEEE